MPAWDGFVVGLDGKRYPYHKATGQLRREIVAFEHVLRHRGSSVRHIQSALADQGIARSVGTIYADLTTWKCPRCSGGQKVAPEHSDAGRTA